jgi:alanine racemase
VLSAGHDQLRTHFVNRVISCTAMNLQEQKDSSAQATLTVNFEALAANYRLLRRQVAPSLVGGVVKANGYGLGAAAVARTLIDEGCRHLFVALLCEARALLQTLSVPVPVYILNGLVPGSEAECARLVGAVPVINSLDQLARWSAEATALGRRLPAVLQVDTGMSRMGLCDEELATLWREGPALLQAVDLHFLMSHLACADDPANPANAAQEARFRTITAAAGFAGVPLSFDNSGGCFLPRDHFFLVRAGIALYGGSPSLSFHNDRDRDHNNEIRNNSLQPVVTLTARIAQLRSVSVGTGVGYGLTYHVQRETRIATVSVGYADGWPRSLGNRGAVFVAGCRAPILGLMSMDSMTVDVTDVPAEYLRPGAPVELIGVHQSLEQVASDAGTISYELLTQLGTRYERVSVASNPCASQ